jgi:hypothetical protein
MTSKRGSLSGWRQLFRHGLTPSRLDQKRLVQRYAGLLGQPPASTTALGNSVATLLPHRVVFTQLAGTRLRVRAGHNRSRSAPLPERHPQENHVHRARAPSHTRSGTVQAQAGHAEKRGRPAPPLASAFRSFTRLHCATTQRVRDAWYAFDTLDIARERVRA